MMRKHIDFFYIFLTAVFLFSCTTLETYIEDSENKYTTVPLIVKYSFLGETFTMENYSLNYKGSESSSAGFVRSKVTAIRKYDFLKNETILCKVEIVKREDKIESNDGNSNTSVIFNSKRYIRIIENNGSKKEYAINMDEKSYLTYRDNGVGSIKINYYQSRDKNNLEQDRLYNTGFNIFINDREYGILAFNPLLFYRKNVNTKIDNNIYDKIVLCILAAYASYLYD